jgi:hypothetical protein
LEEIDGAAIRAEPRVVARRSASYPKASYQRITERMTERLGRALQAPVMVITFALLIGCAGTSDPPGVAGGSVCALDARLAGRSYYANGGIRVIPVPGEALGTASVPDCEGDGGYTFQAMSIVGVPPEIAFVDPEREDIIFVAEDIVSLPPELMTFRREPKCEDEDAPIRLHGLWLGIIGPHEETEVDLLPPYRLEMRVDDASAPRYERTFLTIRVAADSGRLLTRDDVRKSLWEGGDLSVTATCAKGKFFASEATASQPA